MVYFGENDEYILCECETCKDEMYIEKNTVAEEDAYSYHLCMPVKCRCGAVDEYINRAKKSCHIIKREIAALLDLLRRQQNVSNKISDITKELNKKFEPPTFWQRLAQDCLFSLKVFLIMLGAAIGLEILFFLVSGLMFFFGLMFSMPDLSRMGNELFYHVNIFKGWSGHFLSNFGMPNTYNPLNAQIAGGELVLDYIVYAVTGVILFVFYAFLAVLLVKIIINVVNLTFFAGKVVKLKLKINQRSEEYRRQLDDFSAIYKSLNEQIGEAEILPQDYRNLKAAGSILQIFINNRADTLRGAINLFHEDDFRGRMLEYSRSAYNEARQTRRYTKALYMITSDQNIQVEVKDIREESPESNDEKVAEMLKNALSKIKKPPSQKRLAPPKPAPVPVPLPPVNQDNRDIANMPPAENTENTENDEDNTENNNISKYGKNDESEENLSAVFSGAAQDNNNGNNGEENEI